MKHAENEGLRLQPDPASTPFAGSFVDAMRAQRDDEPARQAALVLHALPRVDRDWLLQQLSPVHRERLGDLLGELVQLRIPASAALLDGVRPGTPPEPTTRRYGRSVSAIERRLENSDPQHVAALLEREPVALTARLLSLRDWPWAAGVLERLSPARRRQVQERLVAQSPERVVSPLDTRLLSLLDERLAGGAAEARGRPDAAGRPSRRSRSLSPGFRPLAWLHQLRSRARAGIPAMSRRVER